jgi:hypothetical protein
MKRPGKNLLPLGACGPSPHLDGNILCMLSIDILKLTNIFMDQGEPQTADRSLDLHGLMESRAGKKTMALSDQTDLKIFPQQSNRPTPKEIDPGDFKSDIIVLVNHLADLLNQEIR